VSAGAVLCSAILGVLPLASATPPTATPGVAVEVITVLASYGGNAFDPRLQTHEPHFVAFPYSSYRLLRRQMRQVPWGGRARFNLPGAGELKVKPRTREDAGVALNLALRGQEGRSLFDTSVCLQDHRVLLVGGPRHRDGVLILLIGATAGSGR
jgi:hypothetical protein